MARTLAKVNWLLFMPLKGMGYFFWHEIYQHSVTWVSAGLHKGKRRIHWRDKKTIWKI